MADEHRGLEEIERYLGSKGGLTGGEPQRILHELVRHMIRQQGEIEALKRAVAGSTLGGAPIAHDPEGGVRP